MNEAFTLSAYLTFDPEEFFSKLGTLITKTKEFSQEAGDNIESVNAKFAAMSLAIAAVGTAMVAADVVMMSNFVEWADQTDAFAQRLKVARNELDSFQRAAQILDLKPNEFQTLLVRGQKNIADKPSITKDLGTMGLDENAFKNADQLGRFAQIITALKNVKDEDKQIAIATDIWGREGTKVLMLTDEILKYVEEINRFKTKLHLTESDIAKAAADQEQWEEMKAKWALITLAAGKALLPVYETMVEILTSIADKIAEISQDHPNAFKWAVAGIGILGGLLTLIGLVSGAMIIMGSNAVVAAGGFTAFMGAVLPVVGLIALIIADIGIVTVAVHDLYNALNGNLDNCFIAQLVDKYLPKLGKMIDEITEKLNKFYNNNKTVIDAGLIMSGNYGAAKTMNDLFSDDRQPKEPKLGQESKEAYENRKLKVNPNYYTEPKATMGSERDRYWEGQASRRQIEANAAKEQPKMYNQKAIVSDDITKQTNEQLKQVNENLEKMFAEMRNGGGFNSRAVNQGY